MRLSHLAVLKFKSERREGNRKNYSIMKIALFICTVVIILTATRVKARSYVDKPVEDSKTEFFEIATVGSVQEEGFSTQKSRTQTVFLTECPKNRLLINGRCRSINKVT